MAAAEVVVAAEVAEEEVELEAVAAGFQAVAGDGRVEAIRAEALGRCRANP